MEPIEQILHSVPIFRHCTGREMSALLGQGRLVSIRRGQKLDLRKTSTFNIVVNGLFEIEALGREDIVYLAPGSFFGDMPFTVNRHRGSVKALVDSRLFMFDQDDMYRFFLASFKSMRGYLRIVGRMGFEVSEPGKVYSSGRSRVVTVYSPYGGSGKTLFSGILAHGCARRGRTIVLDMSYRGESVFTLFGKLPSTALSQRQDSEASAEQFVHERIEKVTDNISLLNVAFGSNVMVNPGILSPVLLLLSREYRFIILDLSHQDEALRDRAFELSDLLLVLLHKARDREKVYGTLDAGLREGQRLFYVLNGRYGGEEGAIDGGFILPDLDLGEGTPFTEIAGGITEEKSVREMLSLVSGARRALVCEARVLESLAFAGLLTALSESGSEVQAYYSSAWSFIVIALHLLIGDAGEYRRTLVRLFSEDRLNNLIDISFPKEHVIGSGRIYKYVRDIAGDERVEFFKSVPMAMLAEEATPTGRLFSTGSAAELMSASFLFHPVFESMKVAGTACHSGFPHRKACVEDLLRSDLDDIIFASVQNRRRLAFRGHRVLPFYRKYLDHIGFGDGGGEGDLAEKTLSIEIEEEAFDVEKIIESAIDSSNKLLKEKRI